MNCTCGHSDFFHDGDHLAEPQALGACEDCDCKKYQRDPNWEPPDDPEAWAGGFADNH
jgi:hypothetical protein